jgi:16S rRNA processing protein RimM
MEEYRFRSDTVALVKFCDIDTQQRAQELTGCDVYFPRALADDDDEALSFSMLVGFDLINAATNQSVGRIDSIDDSTANVLFCLDNGLLLPANDDLLERIDVKQRQIVMNIPEGLLDLNV